MRVYNLLWKHRECKSVYGEFIDCFRSKHMADRICGMHNKRNPSEKYYVLECEVIE